ncbi:T9SS type A sorting domain-containing protein [Hymenobacter gummosus]|uniref:T9SS type A sorting domain-containing protein n=1 Tax=Hymenobacter gummosus TaxID=1776032 RepID=A0A431U1N2_9BACT|nr:T9SS type A sorting domain-containing protein [Hymenobacter gummosus]
MVTVWEDARQDRGIYAQNLSAAGLLGPVTATRGPRAALPLALYPNPGPAATLRLQLPLPQQVTLRLTDMTGRLVQLRSVPLPAGVQEVPLRADELAPGLYLVQTEVAGQPLRATWAKQ